MTKFEELMQRCNDFLNRFPNSEYGPAHVVISDYNFEDEFIDYCQNEITKALNGKTGCCALPASELIENQKFLNKIKAVPAAERTHPEDS